MLLLQSAHYTPRDQRITLHAAGMKREIKNMSQKTTENLEKITEEKKLEIEKVFREKRRARM